MIPEPQPRRKPGCGSFAFPQWLAIFVLLASPVFADPSQCELRRVASLDAQTNRDGRISVPVLIEHHPAALIVDTGAAFSALDTSFAASVGLNDEQAGHRGAVLAGGIRLSKYTVANSFSVGPLVTGGFKFILAPSNVLDSDSMGMLGSDVMSNYDVELDFAGGKFDIFSQDHCPGQVVYWTKDIYAQVPIVLDWNRHITVPVMLDGKPVTVILDTGAARSFMNFKTAKDVFGLDEQNPQLKSLGQHRMNGVVTVASYRYPFSSLTFEGIEIRNPDIDIVKYADTDRNEAALTLGIGVLRQLHLYIAYKEKMLYLTSAEAH